MTEAEIRAAIDAFARAAARARAAGFDGVEVHAAHYYLLSEFLSPYANRRSDRWGGDRERPGSRLAVETVKAVRKAVGADYPVFCRMHSEERLEGGVSTEDAVFYARALEAAGADVLDLSGIGTSSMGEWQGQPYLNSSSLLPRDAEGGAFAASAGRVRAAVGIPVITVGKLAEPGVAQGVIERGQADLVALARPADRRCPGGGEAAGRARRRDQPLQGMPVVLRGDPQGRHQVLGESRALTGDVGHLLPGGCPQAPSARDALAPSPLQFQWFRQHTQADGAPALLASPVVFFD